MSLRRPWAAGAAGPLAVALALLLAACGEAELEEPEPLFDEVPVEYPMELWDRGVEGRTVVRVRVNEEGGIDSAGVRTSSGHAAFDSAAIRGVRELRFRPALRDGEPVPVWAHVPVDFSRDGADDTVPERRPDE